MGRSSYTKSTASPCFFFSLSPALKAPAFPLFAAHRRSFQNLYPGFPRRNSVLSLFTDERSFSPVLQVFFYLRFPRVSFNTFILVPPACRHFSCSPKLPFRPPLQTALRPVFFRLCLPDPRPCPAHPFWFFPHLRFSFAFQPARPLSLRLYALFALVPYRPRRPRAPRVLFYAYGFVFPFLHDFPSFKRRLFLFFSGQPFRAVFSFAFRPVRGFPAALFGSNAQKKGRQLPAPIFIYIKNFPMYP